MRVATLIALTFFSAIAVAADVPPANPPAATTMDAPASHTGKVLSSIDASVYTYIEVSEGVKITWIAAPTIALKKGDTISYVDGMVMTNFFSKTLNRTFESVVFVDKIVIVK